MIGRDPFYYNTLRKVVIAFGNLFSDMSIDKVDEQGNFVENIKIPLLYVDKEKFVMRAISETGISEDVAIAQIKLPAMGFEMNSVTYAPERKGNTMEKIYSDKNSEVKSMFNRVPYEVGFTLYIGTRKMDDSFRIVEQILPFFTPELTVKVRDKDDFNISTNIPIVLRNTNFEVVSDGDFQERRSVLWTLEFAAKCYIYADTKNSTVIRRSIVDIRNGVTESLVTEYMAEVDPFMANKTDEWEIKETTWSESYQEGIVEGSAGSDMDVTIT